MKFKTVNKKLLYLNQKSKRSEKEQIEYDLMLKNKDFTNEELSNLIQQIGIETIKGIFTKKLKVENNNDALAVGLFFGVILLMLYFEKEKQNNQ